MNQGSLPGPQYVELIVNGSPVTAWAPPELTLLRFLRDQLHLTGTKDGCSRGHCGACTVIVNGKAQRACLLKLAKLAGSVVQTIEGVAGDGVLHPLQEAFIANNAVQCGFCTPGMIMTAKALLDANPSPSAQEIRKALTRNHNLCRCTGYVNIIKAIQDAACHMAESGSYPPGPETANATMLRRDALPLVQGHTRFADDIYAEGMLYGKVRWADHPHAEILGIDTREAESVPGVAAVLTASDVPGRNAFGLVISDQPVFAAARVRYIGDAIAAVFAETELAAEAARDLIRVNYRILPGVFTPAEAAAPGAPHLHEGGNLLKEMRVRRGEIDKAFADCVAIVERDYTSPFVEHAFIEPESGLGMPDAGGGVTVKVPCQAVWDSRRELAQILDLPVDKVHVAQLPIGGAFGGKTDMLLERFLALGALKTGRAVKMTLTREESLRVHAKRHASWIHIKAGVDASGHILALQDRVLLDAGAYASSSAAILMAGCVTNTGPYFIPNLDLHAQAWYTNNVIGGAMRGFGAPKIAFAVESALDELARSLAMDPLEFRLLNALDVGLPSVVDHVQEPGVVTIKQTIRAAQEELRRTVVPPSQGTRRIGVGVACMMKTVGVGRSTPESAGAIVELDARGRCKVLTGYCEMGQGANALLLGLAAQELGLPLDHIQVILPDTDLSPMAGATGGSRQTFLMGNAVVDAARALKGELCRRAADALGAQPDDIRLRGDRLVDTASGQELMLGALGERFAIESRCHAPSTDPLPLVIDSSYGSPGFRSRRTNWLYDFGTAISIVEVDTCTGQVRLLKHIAVFDVGKALNPAAIEGQIHGAVAMMMGYALSEEFVVKNGTNLTDSLQKCHLPTADQAPEIVSVVLEIPCPDGPYGAKGFSEAPTVNVAPAIINAIYDATGVRITSLPANRARVLAGLAKADRVPQ
jgi:CO/xanthine dehydrogenase Mo-binding subunit/aerobic-type carbon monoxide dehydrogenase small subunit (CoxS/CutS family)